MSKLVHATEDALVDAGVLKDDGLIVTMCVSKIYSKDEPPSASIRVFGVRTVTDDRTGRALSDRTMRSLPKFSVRVASWEEFMYRLTHGNPILKDIKWKA